MALIDIPAEADHSVFMKNVTMSDGTNNYVEAKNFRFTWNFVINQETVVGTALPVQGTGEFRGEIEFEVVGATDDTLHDLISFTNGQIDEKTWTVTEKNTDTPQGSRAWSIKARMNSYEESGSEDDFARYRLRGVLTAVPTH